MKLNAKALGLAAGTVKGMVVFLATLFTVYMGGGETLGKLDRFYFGYTVSYQGAFIGLLYALVDGFVLGFIVATLYNLYNREK